MKQVLVKQRVSTEQENNYPKKKSFMAMPGLHCCAWTFSSGEQELLSSYGAQASHYSDFSGCGVWALRCVGFRSCGTQA